MTNARGRMNNAFDPDAPKGSTGARASWCEPASERLGPAYRLFYSDPVHVVRGEGCRLWDADGNEYLDAYNNVVSVGHAHPRVVAAVAQQMRTLCTHTRYLHEGILRYAGELLETFGGESARATRCSPARARRPTTSRCASPSTAPAATGVIVTAEAYHGNSAQTAEISPSLGENSPLGPWVRCVAAPDSYRVVPERRPRLADDVRGRRSRDLERHGDGVAALIVDSAFSSDGIYTDPTACSARRSRRCARPAACSSPTRCSAASAARRRPVGLPAPRRRPRHRHARQADGQRLPGRRPRRAARGRRRLRPRRPLLQHLRRQHRWRSPRPGDARRHPRRGPARERARVGAALRAGLASSSSATPT